MTTTDVLVQARAALDGVTEGPWAVDGPAYPGPDDTLTIYPDGAGGAVAYVQRDWDDALFIVWARDGVPELIAEVERLRAQIESVEQLADAYGHMPDFLSPGSDVADDITCALDGETE